MTSISLNTNLLSLNSQRRLSDHTKNIRSSFDRLSSGLRIRKASDDAAGLAISENLKTDARLSSQALRNVNDGISMVSIVSGALDAQKGILIRMSELAEQSANGTNTQTQRTALQREYLSLMEEFDRVASSTKFNDISLLRNPDSKTISLMAGITGADASLLSVTAANSHSLSGDIAVYTNIDGVNDNIFNISDFLFVRDRITSFIGDESDELDFLPEYPLIGERSVNDSNGNEVLLSFILFSGFSQTIPDASGLTIFGTAKNSSGQVVIQTGVFSPTGNNQLEFSFDDSSTALFDFDISGLNQTFKDLDPHARSSAIGVTTISRQKDAQLALEVIKNKIDDISALQGSFGAVEARLNVAANILQVGRENYSTAASQITDVDVAGESANLVSTQILQQAASSVLSQANLQPQLALQLLEDI